MVAPGEVWLDTDFFGGPPPKRKYLLVLAIEQGDIVHRLLTSQQYARPTDPACFHGLPYAGFYLGVLGGPLVKQSWLELSQKDDLDAVDFSKMVRSGRLMKVLDIDRALLCRALRCTAGAPTTTGRQARRIGDVVATLACP